jgi:beta-barrel assembly-enhancing protease
MRTRFYSRFLCVFFSVAFLQGCDKAVQIAPSLTRVVGATSKAVRPMTEREEYYVGRAVAATILGQYRIYNSDRLTSYINDVGQAVALGSDRPYTQGGYHFVILDTEEVNAMACPGGIIFITRGMLQKARNEEELAAILAHEVAHVDHKDGLASIQKSRWAEAASILGTEATKQVTGADVAKLLSLFEGSVSDVTKTLLVNGYSRSQEEAADQGALTYLHRLGYNPYGLPDVLGRLAQQQPSGGGKGIFATHPGMDKRQGQSKSFLTQKQWTRMEEGKRDRRFRQCAG